MQKLNLLSTEISPRSGPDSAPLDPLRLLIEPVMLSSFSHTNAVAELTATSSVADFGEYLLADGPCFKP